MDRVQGCRARLTKIGAKISLKAWSTSRGANQTDKSRTIALLNQQDSFRNENASNFRRDEMVEGMGHEVKYMTNVNEVEVAVGLSR